MYIYIYIYTHIHTHTHTYMYVGPEFWPFPSQGRASGSPECGAAPGRASGEAVLGLGFSGTGFEFRV